MSLLLASSWCLDLQKRGKCLHKRQCSLSSSTGVFRSDAESCHGCVKQVSLHRISFHSCPFLNCNIPSWVPVFGRAKFGNKYIILELGDNIYFLPVFWVQYLQTGLQCLFRPCPQARIFYTPYPFFV
jgi:hypothetical protein